MAYLAAYAVAVSAIGLFSQYENKYKLRSLESFEHLHTLTMPFLWAPFLLLHLGGPDTITAFSIEDNNLWTRQLLNLIFQLSLALYVFWKSFDLLDWQLLAVAIPLFIAGIIKYGEKIWALKSGSRDSLDCRAKMEAEGPSGGATAPPRGDSTQPLPTDVVGPTSVATGPPSSVPPSPPHGDLAQPQPGDAAGPTTSGATSSPLGDSIGPRTSGATSPPLGDSTGPTTSGATSPPPSDPAGPPPGGVAQPPPGGVARPTTDVPTQPLHGGAQTADAAQPQLGDDMGTPPGGVAGPTTDAATRHLHGGAPTAGAAQPQLGGATGNQLGGATGTRAGGAAWHRADDDTESLALKTTHWCRGLIAGRTLVQLGHEAAIQVQEAFKDTELTDVKRKFVLTELGMIYDMLYTKFMVLQSWTGLFRCIALVAMVVAFVLFWVNQHLHAHRTTNAAITYTLFVGAIFMEVCSILMVTVSPWTKARSRFLCRLSRYLPCQGMPSPTMGQYNLVHYCLSKKSKKKFIPMVLEALGLEKHRRNLWHVKHVEDTVIVNYIIGLSNTDKDYAGVQSQDLKLGQELKYLLGQPFEHALFCMHIFTEMHLSTLGDGGTGVTKVLAGECRKLSNYLMYLMAVYPSMLPVGSAAQDHESLLVEWIRKDHGKLEKIDILKRYAAEILDRESTIKSPFNKPPSETSLQEIREVWARLLMYAAGKCRMELHAWQLGEGLELLTVVGTLMMHHNIGDVGRKLELLAPLAQTTPDASALVYEKESVKRILQERPLYVFEFLQDPTSPRDVQKLYVTAWKRVDTDSGLQTVDTPRSRPGLSSGGADVIMESEEEATRRKMGKGKEKEQEVGESSQMSDQPFVVPWVVEHAVARRRHMGIRHLAVSGAVQSPQGQIPRSLST
ncbi:hypothetical protein ACQ4PT_067189 [Festuca glaucescens]